MGSGGVPAADGRLRHGDQSDQVAWHMELNRRRRRPRTYSPARRPSSTNWHQAGHSINTVLYRDSENVTALL